MKDLIIDTNGNLIVQNGDFQVDNAEQQTAHTLIEAWTGEFKNAPILGGNIFGYLNGTIPSIWFVEIRNQLKRCLLRVNFVRFVNDEIIVKIN